MPQESHDVEARAIAMQVMHDALAVMTRLPHDNAETDEGPPLPKGESALVATRSVSDILKHKPVHRWLQRTIDRWPDGLMPAFIESGSVIGQILAMFGAGRRVPFGIGLMHEPRNLDLMMALGMLRSEEGKATADDPAYGDDPMGLQRAMFDELQRRNLAATVPFAHTLSTLLGPDALLWLTAQSNEGLGKIQPHEFSRANWPQLWDVRAQIAIESELMEVPPHAAEMARVVVALAWTLVALASFMPTGVFLAEATSYLSSERRGHFTVSTGGTRTLIQFAPASMIDLVAILEAALDNDLLTAADLMWMGGALARVRSIKSGIREERLQQSLPAFAFFLSHRGRDAKRRLAEVSRDASDDRLFLDCSTLPRGVINRRFIYDSLARSECILIVETIHFKESQWCRKEAWFAEAMAARRIGQVEHISLDGVAAKVAAIRRDVESPANGSVLDYPVAQRVMRDIDFHGRQPNLYTLKQMGHATDSLAELQTLLQGEDRPNDATWVSAVGETVARVLKRVIAEAPQGDPPALWCAAAQMAVAAFATTSNARSKMAVRLAMDDLNGAIEAIISTRLIEEPTFASSGAQHLGLVAAAAAVAVTDFTLDARLWPAIAFVVGDMAVCKKGLLLFDCRPAGNLRDFRLRLVTTLLQHNVSGVGIIQNAADQVHQGRVGDVPLEILPCVTLYPEMEWLLTA